MRACFTWRTSLICLFVFQNVLIAQKITEVDTAKTEVVINERMIEMYNRMMKSSESTFTLNELFKNYTFDEAKSVLNAYGTDQIQKISKKEIDRHLANEKKKEQKSESGNKKDDKVPI